MEPVNNEIRRLKAKLKLFEEGGFNWVVGDVIDLVNNFSWEDFQKKVALEVLKKDYLEKLQNILPKNSKQGKLEL